MEKYSSGDVVRTPGVVVQRGALAELSGMRCPLEAWRRSGRRRPRALIRMMESADFVGWPCLRAHPARHLGVSQIGKKLPGGFSEKIFGVTGGRADPIGRR